MFRLFTRPVILFVLLVPLWMIATALAAYGVLLIPLMLISAVVALVSAAVLLVNMLLALVRWASGRSRRQPDPEAELREEVLTQIRVALREIDSERPQDAPEQAWAPLMPVPGAGRSGELLQTAGARPMARARGMRSDRTVRWITSR